MSIIAPTWYSPPSLAHRFISLYSPETPLNRYLEHIWGFIAPRTRPPLVGGPPTDLVTTPFPPYHASAPFVPSLYLRVVHTKSEVASTRRSSSSKSSRRQAGERTDLPLFSLSPCFIVSLRAINSRGFTFPWKRARNTRPRILFTARGRYSSV